MAVRAVDTAAAAAAASGSAASQHHLQLVQHDISAAAAALQQREQQYSAACVDQRGAVSRHGKALRLQRQSASQQCSVNAMSPSCVAANCSTRHSCGHDQLQQSTALQAAAARLSTWSSVLVVMVTGNRCSADWLSSLGKITTDKAVLPSNLLRFAFKPLKFVCMLPRNACMSTRRGRKNDVVVCVHVLCSYSCTDLHCNKTAAVQSAADEAARL